MTKRHHWWVLGISLGISVVIWILMTKRSGPEQITRLEAFTVANDSGWGYEIRANDSIYISQEYIPGIPGRKAFPEEQQAKKAADIILEKLKKGQIPVLSTPEREAILQTSISTNESGKEE